MDLTTLVVVALLVLGLVWLGFYLAGNPEFWHVAAQYPDEAYDWFINDEAWIVVQPGESAANFPERNSAYDGPFTLWVPRLDNEKVQVYGRSDLIGESQAAFLEDLQSRGILQTE